MKSANQRGRSVRGGHASGGVRVPAKTRRNKGAAERSSLVIQQTLASYAKRGVFRSYGNQPPDGPRSRFSFRWHADATFHLLYDPSRRTLTFADVLPEIESRSSMYRELKAFVEARTSSTLPDHRRIDPRKVGVAVANRRRMVSLVVSLEDAHLEYGVRKAVNLVHEVFVEFLRNPLYFAYMVERFQLDPDM
jgi:hypothetical protein